MRIGVCASNDVSQDQNLMAKASTLKAKAKAIGPKAKALKHMVSAEVRTRSTSDNLTG